jgi:ribosome-associated protein
MQRTQFKLQGEFIPLNKLLKTTGLCSTGGMAKMVIDDGRVTVDCHTELRKGCKIRKGQVVEFDGSSIEVV